MKRGKISEHGVGRVRYPAYGGITDLPSLSIRGSEMDEMIGKKFGRLTVVEALPRERRSDGRLKDEMWLCACECGNPHKSLKGNLVSGCVRSCGCLKKQLQTTHGMSNDPLYMTWNSIRSRISNPRDKDYPRYGGRGLEMEPEWIDSFPTFRKWILENLGPKLSSELSLDRVKNHLGYLKGNLRWATVIEQQNNRRSNRMLTFQGITANMKQHCNMLGLEYSAVKMRLGSMGWTVEQALGTPTTGDRHYRRPVEEPAEELETD